MIDMRKDSRKQETGAIGKITMGSEANSVYYVESRTLVEGELACRTGAIFCAF